MFVSQDFKLGFRDVNKNYKLTDTALLGFFEDTAGVHSSQVGLGLLDIEKTNLTWFLIYEKVKVLKRLNYGDNIKVTTWTNGKNRLYAFRNYDATNDSGEKVAIASSRWVPINCKDGSIMKLDDSFNVYRDENIINFEDEKTSKIREPENYSKTKEYTVNRAMIDMNNHVHNTYYLSFIYEVLPEELQNTEFDEFEILYKNQIFYNETVKIMYSKDADDNYVVIKSKDESKVHAIIKFK